DFSIEQMLQQMADVSMTEPEEVRRIIFEEKLQKRYESGHISTDEFYATYCEALGRQIDFDALCRASCEIFTPNLTVLPVISYLRTIRFPIGILSNTCDIHWEYCAARYGGILSGFEVHALSYELDAFKPEPAIYLSAAKLAGYAPEEILFIDDMEKNVAGAIEAGFDAVQYVDTRSLVVDLGERGIRLPL
ncbi:unnamed protein product, partial [marine sediment metagenome]